MTRDEPRPAAPTAPADQKLARSARNLLIMLGITGAVGYLFYRGGNFAESVPKPSRMVDTRTLTPAGIERCGLPREDGRPIVVEMVYSEDKLDWIEFAANRFAHLCPNIQLKVTAMGDIESADAILNGEVAPTLWSPADDLVIRYLDYRWKQRSTETLFRIESQVSLARSPMVVMMWEDRVRVLNAVTDFRKSPEGPWVDLSCALVPRETDATAVALEDMVPGSWIDWYGPTIPPPPKKPPRRGRKQDREEETKPGYQQPFPSVRAIERWGRVKIVHTSPTRSASGLEALYLMAYDYLLPPKERGGAASPEKAPETGKGDGEIISSEQLRAPFEAALAERKDIFQRWLRRCEAGLDDAPKSARLLTESMFNVGSSRYDAVVTYEHLAFAVLDEIDDHSSTLANIRVLYPQPTVVNQHPAVLLWPDHPARAEQGAAAKKWLAYLRSKEIQQKAIEYGFRPASSEVTIRSYDVEENPFLHLRRYGVSFSDSLVEPPRLDGKAINDLVRVWEDATGRN